MVYWNTAREFSGYSNPKFQWFSRGSMPRFSSQNFSACKSMGVNSTKVTYDRVVSRTYTPYLVCYIVAPPPGGRHLCARGNKMAYVTLNKFRSNCEHFLYIVPSHFLFLIGSYSSSCADQFSTIASCALSLKNECSCHFLQHHPQL